MSNSFVLSRNTRDIANIPAIRVAFMLSLLLHAMLIWQWLPQLHFL